MSQTSYNNNRIMDKRLKKVSDKFAPRITSDEFKLKVSFQPKEIFSCKSSPTHSFASALVFVGDIPSIQILYTRMTMPYMRSAVK